jgi:hypothetical protein
MFIHKASLRHTSRRVCGVMKYRSIPKGRPNEIAGKASRSNKLAMFWAADYRNTAFWDLQGYLRKLALGVSWPSFGNTTVVSRSFVSTTSALLERWSNSTTYFKCSIRSMHLTFTVPFCDILNQILLSR